LRSTAAHDEEMSSVDTVVPHPLPSLPPSPIEEDLTRVRTLFSEEESSDSESSSSERRRKGKGKQTEAYAGGSSDTLQDKVSGGEAYPPVNDDEAETRRVEENLKRWEMAERQRRKAARETNTPSASLVGDVTRRASLLWPNRRQRPPSRSGLGNHTALRSRESVDAVPLDDIPACPSLSAAPSPLPDENHPGNPFANPSPPLSPFDDSQQQTALMTPSSDPPPEVAENEDIIVTPKRPVLIASASSSSRPPPPQPLGLPKPRTPPPPIDAPYTNRPPQALSLPIVARTSPNSDGDVGETRWWHDWLCGCGEGPDRGGDNQAGRTNPFE